MIKMSEYILYEERSPVEDEAVASPSLIQGFCQRGGGGEKDDGLVVELLFAQACGDKEADVAALDKSACDGGGIEYIDPDLVEGGELACMLRLLAAVHVFLKLAHGATGFVLIAGGAFLFLVGGFLRLVCLLSGCLDARGDEVERELF